MLCIFNAKGLLLVGGREEKENFLIKIYFFQTYKYFVSSKYFMCRGKSHEFVFHLSFRRYSMLRYWSRKNRRNIDLSQHPRASPRLTTNTGNKCFQYDRCNYISLSFSFECDLHICQSSILEVALMRSDNLQAFPRTCIVIFTATLHHYYRSIINYERAKFDIYLLSIIHKLFSTFLETKVQA